MPPASFDLHSASPNARALYWYLEARGPKLPIQQIAEESGIPLSSLYKVAQRYPETFEITGRLLKLSRPAEPNEATLPHSA